MIPHKITGSGPVIDVSLERTSTARFASLPVDQNNTVPDISENRARQSVIIQASGTTAVIVGTGNNLTAANGIILRGGTIANDGNGGTLTLDNYVGPIWLFDVSGVGTTVRYMEIG